jgi:hypothetical protein
VTTTRAGKNFTDAPKGRIVHHVYAAAFNYAGDVTNTAVTREIGGKLLAAEYQATVTAAWALSQKCPGRKGSNKLFLTLLGGGVFENAYEMICKAIKSSQELIVKSGLEVYVVCFSGHTFNQVFPLLKGAMAATGGKVIGK